MKKSKMLTSSSLLQNSNKIIDSHGMVMKLEGGDFFLNN
jgi:hypothetical protein